MGYVTGQRLAAIVALPGNIMLIWPPSLGRLAAWITCSSAQIAKRGAYLYCLSALATMRNVFVIFAYAHVCLGT